MLLTAGMGITSSKGSIPRVRLSTKAASQEAKSVGFLGITGKQSCTWINLKMPTPKIDKILKNGEWVWEVSYAGTVQYHKQDWQAKWLYEQAVQAYSRKVSS